MITDTKLVAREARILEYQRNILASYRRATAEQIAEGKTWYPRVKKQVTDIARASGLEIASYVFSAFSALSPRVTFQENLKGFEAYTRYYRATSGAGRLVPVVAGTDGNRRKAWGYLTGEITAPIDRKSAPKTARFADNLAGNLSPVTIDVWAARAAGIEGSPNIRGTRYEELEEAYQRVARIVGFEPAELQAIVWIVTRGRGE